MKPLGVAMAWMLAGFAALGCAGEDAPAPSGAPLARAEAGTERASNRPPLIERLVLVPATPLPGHTIEARVDVSDPDGDAIRFEFEWRHQGRTLAKGGRASVTPDGLEKGDSIELIALATDGRAWSQPARAQVSVGNRVPLIQGVALSPEEGATPGSEITAAVRALDPDGDALAYDYAWSVNGLPALEKDASFDTRHLKRGDRVQAHVRVSDGESWSPTAESAELELANRPPSIRPLQPPQHESGALRYRLEADDPDGDEPLRFELLSGPPGLSVDPASGLLSWQPGPDVAGSHDVEVAVYDALGAASALRFDVSVNAREEARPAQAAEAAD
jgi:hypothetical protein